MKTYRVGIIPLFAAILFVVSLQFILIDTVSAASYTASTDPMRGKQTYLDRIGVDGAWAATPAGGKPLIVAVVDTGVDLTHPDLKANLMAGVNLLDPDALPQDDYGHGTNVAGIVAASVNNDKGIAGIARNVKIMPIKALDSDGYGGEQKLGEGIRYAVDHGANIVILSLGLNKQSDYLEEIVRYAEEKNVLLVAAVGNDGGAIKYPAAYPSVLAVGGFGLDDKLEPRSNYGPELDLVAPWTVYTTALNGRYEYKEGSSMAAPQVAGVAALIWSKYPEMKAYQIRDLLRQSAEDKNAPGWDAYTGYGQLRADLALTKTLSDDSFEPNDVIEQAQPLAVESVVSASFGSGDDQDWYRLDSEYSGTVTLRGSWDGTVAVKLRTAGPDGEYVDQSIKSGETVRIPVTKGSNYIMLQAPDIKKGAVRYRLETTFQIYVDPFEDNDRLFKAFRLPARSQSITGTFHDAKDQDWFKIVLPKSGKLRISVSVDTLRIDPVLTYQRNGEKAVIIDKKGDGIGESTPLLQALPGEYWIRVSNFKESMASVAGEYILTIEYKEQAIDPYEPNDRPFQATVAVNGALNKGVIDNERDVDWFHIQVTKESDVQFEIKDLTQLGKLEFIIYNLSMQEMGSLLQADGVNRMQLKRHLEPGLYLIKIKANVWKDRMPYTWTVR